MIDRIMLRILLTLTGLLYWGVGWSQWQDLFEDGLEPWHGTKEFFVTDSGSLHSRGPGQKSVLYLSRAFNDGQGEDSAFYHGVCRGDSALCFEFGIALRFVPSSTNSLRIYLFCMDSVLSAEHSLYLQLGQKGGENRWSLFYEYRDSSRMLWQGSMVYSRQKQMDFNLRAVYVPDRSCWRFYHSTGHPGQVVWQQDGDSLRTDFMNPFFFRDSSSECSPLFYSGIMALYQTASRADKYVFDYARVGRLPSENAMGSDRLALPSDTLDGTVSTLVGRICHIPSAGSLAISEVLFAPRSGESRFVEICNLSDTVFSMSGMALGIWDGKAWKYSRLLKDRLLLLSPYAYMAFAKDAGAISSLYRSAPENIHTANAFPALNSKAGKLRLVWLPVMKDSLSDTIVIDEVFYSEEFHHWLLPETEGVSLERLDIRKPALTQENWMSAAETAGYATPGCGNSHRRNSGEARDMKYFSLEPSLVTPDNDGRNDFLYIRWHERLSGCVCSMTVYDGSGRKMKTLCHQSLLGSGGEIRYDATDHTGRVLRPGIYVLYIDLIQSDRRHRRLRYVLAVG